VSASEVVLCPTCDAPCSAGASRCECGQAMRPEPLTDRRVHEPKCTCGGRGQCLNCVLTDLEEGRL
jgi:hypothetical protein